MNSNSPIGVFDSGVGGLTVAREIMRQLPHESIIYFGDTARVPYGNKSADTIITYSKQIAHFLMKQDVKAIVIACNTASALALEALQQEITIPIIGVVEPGAKAALKATRNNNIGVIGTEGTINSDIYTKFLKAQNPAINVHKKACPLFVPLVEEGMLKDPVTDEMIRRYTKDLIDLNIDSLVLGCTHYPLLRNAIHNILGDSITLVNPAYETAISLGETLKEHNLLTTNAEANHVFYVSDGADKFKEFAGTILPCNVVEINDIHNIETYN
ncbi:MAG: glutamate racemase [Lachnospiraceae bacterium]|nr:glutamate racemase [Lachnospiraceae bacterium]